MFLHWPHPSLKLKTCVLHLRLSGTNSFIFFRSFWCLKLPHSGEKKEKPSFNPFNLTWFYIGWIPCLLWPPPPPPLLTSCHTARALWLTHTYKGKGILGVFDWFTATTQGEFVWGCVYFKLLLIVLLLIKRKHYYINIIMILFLLRFN